MPVSTQTFIFCINNVKIRTHEHFSCVNLSKSLTADIAKCLVEHVEVCAIKGVVQLSSMENMYYLEPSIIAIHRSDRELWMYSPRSVLSLIGFQDSILEIGDVSVSMVQLTGKTKGTVSTPIPAQQLGGILAGCLLRREDAFNIETESDTASFTNSDDSSNRNVEASPELSFFREGDRRHPKIESYRVEVQSKSRVTNEPLTVSYHSWRVESLPSFEQLFFKNDEYRKQITEETYHLNDPYCEIFALASHYSMFWLNMESYASQILTNIQKEITSTFLNSTTKLSDSSLRENSKRKNRSTLSFRKKRAKEASIFKVYRARIAEILRKYEEVPYPTMKPDFGNPLEMANYLGHYRVFLEELELYVSIQRLKLNTDHKRRVLAKTLLGEFSEIRERYFSEVAELLTQNELYVFSKTKLKAVTRFREETENFERELKKLMESPPDEFEMSDLFEPSNEH